MLCASEPSVTLQAVEKACALFHLTARIARVSGQVLDRNSLYVTMDLPKFAIKPENLFKDSVVFKSPEEHKNA